MDTYAVVLYFDAATNDTLKKVIKNIAAISKNRYMIDVKIPPHITIGSFFSDGHADLLAVLDKFANTIESFEVKFNGIRAFEPKVLFLSPVKDTHLKQLNILLHETLLKDYPPADNENYIPEKWIPHCALAVRLDEAQFQKAKSIAEKTELPAVAKVQKIALARCNPYKEIAVWDIKNSESELTQ